MARKDQERWNQKWLFVTGQADDPHPLLKRFVDRLTGETALDIACGRGQNGLYLAKNGFQVLGVDISNVALEMAKKSAADQDLEGRIHFKQADLDIWKLPQEVFDVIVVFRFLNRSIFHAIEEGLRSGGWLVYSSRNMGILASEPKANKDYLLKRGELSDEFRSWELIYSHEGDVDSSIVVRKPLSFDSRDQEVSKLIGRRLGFDAGK